MSLTPDDIEHQVFKERFRGYDQDEVDRFLDRVAQRIGELTRERDELAERVDELERQSGQVVESEKLLQRALLTAQRTADETIDEARATAEQTIEDARREADALIAEAHRRIDEDEQRALDVLDHVRRAAEDLTRFRTEYRERVEAVIAEQLAMLDRAGDLPELPDGLRSLAQSAAPVGEESKAPVGDRPEAPAGEERDAPTGQESEADEPGRVYWQHGSE